MVDQGVCDFSGSIVVRVDAEIFCFLLANSFVNLTKWFQLSSPPSEATKDLVAEGNDRGRVGFFLDQGVQYIGSGLITV
ncbi:unnamed protein product [Sphenostylis stenocarpa]|uniref:Uncharacterized protein n=1 Tax=Sphenostylis stenocarpa TaxID=92480 RepID=A0AA86S919_9FABA|nr:unnamed protein product [Sphenostylis stenocarpa]